MPELPSNTREHWKLRPGLPWSASLWTRGAALGLVWLLSVFAVLVFAGSTADASPPPSQSVKQAKRIAVYGNDVIPVSLIAYALDLPEDGELRESHRQDTERRIETLLHDVGYKFAEVYTWLGDDGRIHVVLDEGVLSKVRVAGANTPNTLSLRLDFQLPGMVFNSELLDDELSRLADSYGFAEIDARVIYTPPAEPRLVEAKTLHADLLAAYASMFGALDRRKALAAFWSERRGSLELHLTAVKGGGGGSGLGLELDFEQPLGLAVGASWKTRSLLFDDDRLEINGLVGNSTEFLFTRTTAELTWDSPRIGNYLRTGLETSVDVLRLSRNALDISEFDRFTVRAGGLLSAWFGQSRFSISSGYGFREVFSLQKGPDTPAGVTTSRRAGAYIGLEGDIPYSPDDRRPDKVSNVKARATFWSPFSNDEFVSSRLDWRHVAYNGFSEVVVRAQLQLVAGPGRVWSDDPSVNSDAVHVVPGDITFSPLSFTTGLEYRFSLFRDVVHLPVFAGMAIFARENYEEPSSRTMRYATSGGVGIGVWIIDSLQLDAYWAHGVGNRGTYGQDLVLKLDTTF